MQPFRRRTLRVRTGSAPTRCAASAARGARRRRRAEAPRHGSHSRYTALGEPGSTLPAGEKTPVRTDDQWREGCRRRAAAGAREAGSALRCSVEADRLRARAPRRLAQERLRVVQRTRSARKGIPLRAALARRSATASSAQSVAARRRRERRRERGNPSPARARAPHPAHTSRPATLGEREALGQSSAQYGRNSSSSKAASSDQLVCAGGAGARAPAGGPRTTLRSERRVKEVDGRRPGRGAVRRSAGPRTRPTAPSRRRSRLRRRAGRHVDLIGAVALEAMLIWLPVSRDQSGLETADDVLAVEHERTPFGRNVSTCLHPACPERRDRAGGKPNRRCHIGGHDPSAFN